MRKIVIAIVFFGLLTVNPGCSSQENATHSIPSPTEFIVLPIDAIGELINTSSLRSGPGMKFDEIATLPQGVNIQIIGASPDINWYLIAYGDSQGLSIRAWIPAESVKIKLQASSNGYPSTTPATTPSLLSGDVLTLFSPAMATLAAANTLTSVPTLIIPPTLTFTSTASSVTRLPNPNPGSTIQPPISQPTLPPPQPTSTKPLIVKPTPPFFIKSPTPTR